jgi:membrane associated rhomboid family serine protease
MATMSPLDGALVTRTILVATAIIWVLGRTSMREELFQYLAYYGPAVAGGEIWRMFSLVLIHASSFWHIGFNMYALYIFGPAIERSLGKLAFMTLYLMTAALGSLVVYLYSHPETVAVGASGAIFGILGMWMYRAYRLRDTAMGQAQLRQYGFMIAINAAIPLFVPSVAWKAHVGGFLAGVLAAYVMSTVKSRKISTGIVALIGVLAAFAPAAL